MRVSGPGATYGTGPLMRWGFAFVNIDPGKFSPGAGESLSPDPSDGLPVTFHGDGFFRLPGKDCKEDRNDGKNEGTDGKNERQVQSSILRHGQGRGFGSEESVLNLPRTPGAPVDPCRALNFDPTL